MKTLSVSEAKMKLRGVVYALRLSDEEVVITQNFLTSVSPHDVRSCA